MAEVGLFIIWNSRRKGMGPKYSRQVAAARHKGIGNGTDEADETPATEPEQEVKEAPTLRANKLRQRPARKTSG